MGIQFVNAAHNSNINSTSLSVTKPTNTVDGDVMVAFVLTGGATTITPPTGWTSYLDTTPNVRSIVYYKAASSEGASYSWSTTGAGNEWVIIIVSYRGVNNTTPIHANNTTSSAGGATSFTSAAITTTITTLPIVMGYFDAINTSTFTAVSTAAAYTRRDQAFANTNFSYAAGVFEANAVAAAGSVAGISMSETGATAANVDRTVSRSLALNSAATPGLPLIVQQQAWMTSNW